jgi:signal transduction histidine kinase
MIVSQLLLTLFVAYWLRSQYRTEKDRLSNLLTTYYIDTQDEIVDTLLFKSYVHPVLRGEAIQIEHRILGKDSVAGNSGFVSGPDRSVIAVKDKKGLVTINIHSVNDSAGRIPDSARFRKINDEMLIRSVKLIVSHSGDTLSEDKPFMRALSIAPDSAVFKKHFQARLIDSGMKFMLFWNGVKNSAAHSHGKRLKVDIVNPFSLPAVTIGGYNNYLIRQILPQLVFGIVLIFITALAFIISYRSIREHVILGNLRNEFISNITHELKTPVATISVALEALGKYNMKDNPAVAEEYLKLASSETSRLEELVNRVLDHSMLEEHNQPYKMMISDLNSLVTEVAEIMRSRLEKGKIEVSLPGKKITVNCDPLFIKGVLINLIDNSIKYCDKEPLITVSVTEKFVYAEIVVADNGPGIPREYRKKIFEKFFRLPSNNIHNVKGYGLGLSFASLVMNSHKGSIELADCSHGCSIILKLPVCGE